MSIPDRDTHPATAHTAVGFELNHWYGPVDARDAVTYQSYTTQSMWLSPTRVRTVQKWYCEPLSPPPVGSRAWLALGLGKSDGTPSLVSGTISTPGASTVISRIGAGRDHPIDGWDWSLGYIEFAPSAEGTVVKIIPES